jgi:glycosyltransferase involved in cell wall biosynthesis
MLVPNRGLLELVDAMRQLDDCALVLMGSGHLFEAIGARIAEMGLSERVELDAAVPFAEMMCRTASSDAAVIPIVGTGLSYRYAAPQKLFEAMMVGVPVVASDLPEMAGVVSRERVGTLIADPTDPSSIAMAVRSLFALGEEELARMGARARDAALSRYSWQTEKYVLLDVYGRLGVLPAAEDSP